MRPKARMGQSHRRMCGEVDPAQNGRIRFVTWENSVAIRVANGVLFVARILD